MNLAKCDWCGKEIQPIFEIRDDKRDDIWNKEYNRRKNLVKGKIARFFANPNMPFEPIGYFCFCSEECYAKWKEKAKERFKEK